MKKLETQVWTSVITTIQGEIEAIDEILKNKNWENDKFLKERKSNLEIALKEFETQQLEDLLN